MSLWIAAVALCLLYFGIKSWLPLFYLKPIKCEMVNNDQFCLIDIREYIQSNRKPVKEAENIPLSILKRQLREKTICNKRILLIVDDHHAARAAARILAKQKAKPIYYMTVS